MIRLAANLTFLFGEYPFPERFAAAAEAGFAGVEVLFPYAYPSGSMAARLREAQLEPVLFNLPPGDWEAGERGLAALPGREAAFEAALDEALDYARAVGCPRLHVMAGVAPAEAGRDEVCAVYRRNLTLAARRLAPHGITALIEPINPRDIPGYVLTRQDEALAVLDAVAEPNLRLQVDLYHCQIVDGDLATRIRRAIGRIGHFQIAGVPDRNEPDRGEINYPYLLELIDSLGYGGWISCEYRPDAGTAAGLAWARPYGIGG